jgi:hypothetical protein
MDKQPIIEGKGSFAHRGKRLVLAEEQHTALVMCSRYSCAVPKIWLPELLLRIYRLGIEETAGEPCPSPWRRPFCGVFAAIQVIEHPSPQSNTPSGTPPWLGINILSRPDGIWRGTI